MENSPPAAEREVAALHPLTPKYLPTHHAVYFNAIKSALAWTGESTVRNIALTGSYGVGKSSILRQVADDASMDAIQVSLSTLGFEQPTRPSVEANPDVAEGDSPNPRRESTTNQIQKEIVKQLLYTQMPERMPGSRYRRTAAFRWRRELAVALASGVPLAAVFFLLGWTAKIASLFMITTDWAIAANAGMVVLAAGLILGIRYGTHNKIRIDSVSAGAATITLSAKSDTYFDEYLDELVYFFQVVKTDIIIFEDIDRFEDPHIFETLRELNTILNAAKQLNGRVIRFVYAIKDSIFEELGVRAAREAAAGSNEGKKAGQDRAILEIARANRTKFFDLVIPVVPFVTHQSARELMSGELKDLTHKVSDGLVDLVAQHVPDMRLIKNIRNEFVVFREQVIGRSSLDLSNDHLFAMVLYKSTHLSDFERVRLGTSNLDTLYRESRTLIQEHSSRLNNELVELQRRVRSLGDQSERADEVGAAIEGYIALVLGHAGHSMSDIRYDGTPIPATDLHTADFWQKYSDGSASLAFTFYNANRNHRLSELTRDEMERATGFSLDPADWEANSRVDLERRIANTQSKLTFLSNADMRDLMTRSDVTVAVDGDEIPFSQRVEDLLGSRLAVDLVAQGYIDRYFTLYTSTFPGDRINANAMNFILKSVDAGAMDIYANLTQSEAETVLRERPRLAVSGRCAYNLDFVSYLLSDVDAQGARSTLLSNLQRNGDDEQQFLQAFLASAQEAATLVHELAQVWPNILVSLLEEFEFDDQLLLSLIDAALSGLMVDLEYVVDEVVSEYIARNYLNLTAFTGATARAPAIAALLKACDFDVPELPALDAQTRSAVVDVGRFTVTRRNLLAAIAPTTDLSLDALKRTKPVVFKRVLRALDAYLESLVEGEPSVTDPGDFVAVISEIDRVDRRALPAVVARSVDACRVESLADVTAGTWPALAIHTRFPASFANVTSYIDQWDVDANLAAVLASGVIDVPSGTANEEKLDLALNLVQSGRAILSADLRASLVESLEMSEPMAAETIPVEDGELVGRLIQRGVITDSGESFKRLGEEDWAGLEFAISVSRSLPLFIDAGILPPTFMVRFLDSADVPSTLKDAVVGRFAEFSESAQRSVVVRMATHAVDHSVAVAWDDVERIARSRPGSAIVLRLLRRWGDSVTIGHLRPILTELGGGITRCFWRPMASARRCPTLLRMWRCFSASSDSAQSTLTALLGRC
ncbi:hypothetical protein IFU30_10920 [Plantibacter sp. CFBP 8798]|uniref:YobI family P-loop NTPase n=1 Tax=Plantibacter sp. CFBP 8798 TaxID=2775268 RepID=UPI00178733E9|nr:hypothetical protein [Plantibacter sp. CFBP 8798]MBD8466779.1 hypothetical protein [Plantibacter sp. CFBP 8798]